MTTESSTSTATVSDLELLSPEVIRSLPNICLANRKKPQGFKSKKSLFLTDTPVKHEIEAEVTVCEAKKRAKTPAKKPKVKKAIFAISNSYSSDDAISIHD